MNIISNIRYLYDREVAESIDSQVEKLKEDKYRNWEKDTYLGNTISKMEC